LSHHKLIGFYNRDEKGLQRGTDWAFKKSSLRFVFEGLILPSSIPSPQPRNLVRKFIEAIQSLNFADHLSNTWWSILFITAN
jgi:hypothetical protein